MFLSLASSMNLLAIALAALGNLQTVVGCNGNEKIESVTTAQMSLLAPASAKGCGGKEFKDECIDAAGAAMLFTAAMGKWKVKELGRVAAALSNMAFESGDFVYNIHHFPKPRPGQGTRAMLMFPFVLEFAKASGFEKEVTKILGKSSDGMSEEAIAKVPADQMNDIRKLVLDPNYTFGSGLWYLTKKCSPDISDGLKAGTFAGFKAYVEKCIRTGETITPEHDRVKKWCLTIKSLGSTPPSECPKVVTKRERGATRMRMSNN